MPGSLLGAGTVTVENTSPCPYGPYVPMAGDRKTEAL